MQPRTALRSSSERNPTESSTPLGFVLAPPKELTAYCSACASAYNPLTARLPACTARSLAHVNRSSSERNPTESTALHDEEGDLLAFRQQRRNRSRR